MCFSAEVSFVSAGVLAVTGFVCTREAFKTKSHFLLAVTPFLFAIQQFFEGLVWIGINSGNHHLTGIYSKFYLFFAFLFWLIWFPTVAYNLELIKWKKWFFIFLIFLGCIFGLYLWLPILLAEGPRKLLETNICGKSICYILASGGYFSLVTRESIYVSLGLLYLVCSDIIFKKFWILVLLSALLTVMTHEFAWTSVWCFFSAIASLYIFYLIKKGALKN